MHLVKLTPSVCVYALTHVHIYIKEKKASAEMLAFHAGSSLQVLFISGCIYQSRV